LMSRTEEPAETPSRCMFSVSQFQIRYDARASRPAEVLVFCPNCGTQNSETAQTCAKCGFQLKAAAAPKFKGTMLMMNQPPGGIPGAPPRPVPGAPPPQAAPPAQAAQAGPPSGAGSPSSAGFTAEAPPIGAAAPAVGAATAK